MMKIIKLVEDYYQLLDPKTQKEIDSSNLRDKVSNNIVDSSIVKKLNTIEDIQAILTNTDLDIDPKIKRELLELFLAKNSIPLSGDEETIIVAKLLKEDPVKIFSGNSSWFELVRNLKEYKLDYDVIEAIDNLNKSKDITNQDMKNKNSWLYNPNIWEEEKPQDQIYKIKLKIFLDDKNNLKKFANADGVPITEIDDESIKKLLEWETAIEKPASILRQQYQQFTSDKYDDEQEAKNREEKGKITFEEYLEQLFKDTEKSKNPWNKDNYISQINKIINSNTTLNEAGKKDLINNLNILVQDKLTGKLLRYKIESRLDIINKENHRNLFIKWLQEFFKNSADLADAAEKQVPTKKLKAVPGKQYKFKEALKFLNLGEGNSPNQLALKLSRIKSERENLTNYTSQLQKILNNKKARKLLFEAPIIANKDGSFNIIKFLKKYIEGAIIPKT